MTNSNESPMKARYRSPCSKSAIGKTSSGWNNLTKTIAFEIAFQLTCQLNPDSFNMYDRELYLRQCFINMTIMSSIWTPKDELPLMQRRSSFIIHDPGVELVLPYIFFEDHVKKVILHFRGNKLFEFPLISQG